MSLGVIVQRSMTLLPGASIPPQGSGIADSSRAPEHRLNTHRKEVQMKTGTQMVRESNSQVTVRAATAADAESCAAIFFSAFESIAARHGFPIEPSSPEFTRFQMGMMLSSPGIAGLVAERDHEVIGSAFADERGAVVGIGPVSVSPSAQDAGVGRALMEALLARQRERGAVAVRLVQTAYHYRSLALYAKLGFTVREPLSVFQGAPPSLSIPGCGVRPALEADAAACEQLCTRVHGHARTAELLAAIAAGTARVVERPQRISGYATGIGYGWHAVAETNEDLIALLASTEAIMGLGVIVPSRNAELLAWCLSHGLSLVQQSTLMTLGLFSEPAGAWLPSIVY
jgi:predicted N-acetyltransferase YhbS